MDSATAVRSILKAAGSTFVTVTFTKRDGSERVLTFNPLQHLETQGTGRQHPDDVFTVVDKQKTQWRSFRANSVKSIKARGKVYVMEAS